MQFPHSKLGNDAQVAVPVVPFTFCRCDSTGMQWLAQDDSNINEASDNLVYCQVTQAELSQTDLIKNS